MYTYNILVVVTQEMLLLNGNPTVNLFLGLKNEKSLIMIYHYKQTQEGNKLKKGQKKYEYKEKR